MKDRIHKNFFVRRIAIETAHSNENTIFSLTQKENKYKANIDRIIYVKRCTLSLVLINYDIFDSLSKVINFIHN
jgi:hypothetical protein